MTKNQESSISSSGDAGCGCLLLLICIGVGAIALPSFLAPRNEPIFTEAQQYVASFNKAQQVYYAEESVFRTSVEALEIVLKTETANYKYSVRVTKKAALSYGVSKQKELKSYVGGVFVVPAKEVDPNAAKHEILTTQSIICKADHPGPIKPAEPTYQNGEWVCGKGTTQVTK